MAVPVQAGGGQLVEVGGDAFNQIVRHLGVVVAHVVGGKVALQDVVEVRAGGGFRMQADAVPRRVLFAHGMQTGQQAAQFLPLVRGGLFQCAPALLGKNGEGQSVLLVQDLAVHAHQRGHHGDLRRAEFGQEILLILQGVPAPAARPVELGHHPGAVIHLHVIDPVDVAAQGPTQVGGRPAQGLLHHLDHAVRRQLGKVSQAWRCFSHELHRRDAEHAEFGPDPSPTRTSALSAPLR